MSDDEPGFFSSTTGGSADDKTKPAQPQAPPTVVASPSFEQAEVANAAEAPVQPAPAAAVPPTPMPRTVQAEQDNVITGRETHVVRGVLWGLMLGLGLTIVAVLTTTISLDLTQMIIVLLVGVAIGTLWSLFGPPKKP